MANACCFKIRERKKKLDNIENHGNEDERKAPLVEVTIKKFVEEMNTVNKKYNDMEK